eukprot:5027532-Amphidinium_carterae.1
MSDLLWFWSGCDLVGNLLFILDGHVGLLGGAMSTFQGRASGCSLMNPLLSQHVDPKSVPELVSMKMG